MPFQLDVTDRRTLTIAGGVLALLVATALVLVPREPGGEAPSTYSTASSGAKAAYLLLRAGGFTVERWEHPPGELPEPAGKVLIVAGPTRPIGSGDRNLIRAFASRGGRVILAGQQADAFFPVESIAPDIMTGYAWMHLSPAVPSAAARVAPRIAMARRAHWVSRESGTPLFAGDNGRVMVVRVPEGSGELVWWASPTPLTNAGLTEPGNLEFFLACLGDPATVTVIWDEYFHGHRRSLAASAAHSPVAWLLVQLGIGALAVLATFSRRSGPVMAPRAETRLATLEFVRTLGTLYHRARAAGVAVEIVYSRFRYRLTRRLAVPPTATPRALAAALGDRMGFDDPGFESTLEACEAARTRDDLHPKDALELVRALRRYDTMLKLSSGQEKSRWKR